MLLITWQRDILYSVDLQLRLNDTNCPKHILFFYFTAEYTSDECTMFFSYLIIFVPFLHSWLLNFELRKFLSFFQLWPSLLLDLQTIRLCSIHIYGMHYKVCVSCGQSSMFWLSNYSAFCRIFLRFTHPRNFNVLLATTVTSCSLKSNVLLFCRPINGTFAYVNV